MQAVINTEVTVKDRGPQTDLPIIRTFTGKFINVNCPNLEDIVIEDIAHGLSNISRFGGHTESGFSVAQHCCMVTDYIMRTFPDDKKLHLAALLHDASEAYLGDMPSPIKAILPDYKRLEGRLMKAIAFKFDFKYPLPVEVKMADDMALSWEWHHKVIKNDANYPASRHDFAKAEFLNLYHQITNA